MYYKSFLLGATQTIVIYSHKKLQTHELEWTSFFVMISSWMFQIYKKKLDKKWKVGTIESLKLQVFGDLDWDVLVHLL